MATLVAFHAHPDDEALLTGGTLARVAAEGHRVVLVIATDGAAGLAPTTSGADLVAVRLAELGASAHALGVARLEVLGYPDSGYDARVPDGFAQLVVELAAQRLAALLREESADALTIYDQRGGYGHADHVQVHRVGVRAAELAGTPVVLEATVDRELLRRVTRAIGWLPGIPRDFTAERLAAGYTPRGQLTHRVDVRRFAVAKRASMAAHASQSAQVASADARTLAVFLRLPFPLFRLVFGREWFVERGRSPGPLLDDVFASLR